MKINLNYWQIWLLFLPAIASEVVLKTSTGGFHQYQRDFSIANMLLTFNLCLVIAYQAYLGLAFNQGYVEKSRAYKINALIPVIGLTMYLMYVICMSYLKPITHTNYVPGPLKKSDMRLLPIIIVMLLIYAIINFYFINNQFVARRIKYIADTGKQELARTTFLVPMKRLVKVSIYLIIIDIAVWIVLDLIKYSS